MMVSYAQNGEDVILARIFSTINSGFYVDVGACHPEKDSVTKHFYDKGWNGLNLEPNPDLISLFQIARPRDINLGVAVGETRGRVDYFPTQTLGHGTLRPDTDAGTASTTNRLRVPQIPLRDLVAYYGPDDGNIGFLKVDVEGSEAGVLSSGDWVLHRPVIVLVEAVDLRGHSTYHLWEEILLGAEYKFCLFDGLNRFYCRTEDLESVMPKMCAPANILDKYIRADHLLAVQEATEQSASMKILENQCEDLRIQVSSLSDSERDLRGENAALQQASEVAASEIDRLRTAVNDASRAKRNSDELMLTLEAEIAILKEEVESLQEKAAAAFRREELSEKATAEAEMRAIVLQAAVKNECLWFTKELAALQKVEGQPEPLMLTIPSAQEMKSARAVMRSDRRFNRLWRKRRMIDRSFKARRSLVEKSGLFDSEWYLSVHPDLRGCSQAPIDHFIEHGSLELRSPSAGFDAGKYLAIYPDVAEARVEPLFHYLLFGRAEGRRPPRHGSDD